MPSLSMSWSDLESSIPLFPLPEDAKVLSVGNQLQTPDTSLIQRVETLFQSRRLNLDNCLAACNRTLRGQLRAARRNEPNFWSIVTYLLSFVGISRTREAIIMDYFRSSLRPGTCLGFSALLKKKTESLSEQLIETCLDLEETQKIFVTQLVYNLFMEMPFGEKKDALLALYQELAGSRYLSREEELTFATSGGLVLTALNQLQPGKKAILRFFAKDNHFGHAVVVEATSNHFKIFDLNDASIVQFAKKRSHVEEMVNRILLRHPNPYNATYLFTLET